MLKKMAMIAVSATLATVTLATHPNKSTHKKESSAPQEDPPIILATPNHQSNAETDKANTHSDPPHTNTSVPDPNWFLFGIGCVTCVVISWQSWETRKAARAARDSVLLQEATYEQWVHLCDWGNQLRHPPYGDVGYRLAISVGITNPSDCPLTLLGGMITYEYQDKVTFAVPTDTRLIPNDPYIARVEVKLTNEDLVEYCAGHYGIMVSAALRYKSVIGKIRLQEFGGILIPDTSRTRFEPHVFFRPSRRGVRSEPYTDQAQNPN